MINTNETPCVEIEGICNFSSDMLSITIIRLNDTNYHELTIFLLNYPGISLNIIIMV